MKVSVLSTLSLVTTAMTSLAGAQPTRKKDVLQALSMAHPVELSDAELDRVSGGKCCCPLCLLAPVSPAHKPTI
jgi:hypothetical protein